MKSLAPPIESNRLILVPLTLGQMRYQLDDYQRLERTLALDETTQSLPGRLRSVIAHSIGMMKKYPEHRIWHTYWPMVLKSKMQLIGGTGFKGPPDEEGMVEIGYGINEEYRSKGLTTEAVSRIVVWALAQQGVASIKAETANNNIASMRVLQKVGFRLYRATDHFLYWRLDTPPASYPEDGQRAPRPDDLHVTVEAARGNIACDMQPDQRLVLRRGSSLALPDGGYFCIRAVESLLERLTAQQAGQNRSAPRQTDGRLTCSHPSCDLAMRIDHLVR